MASSDATATLLITCRDQKGIVAAVSDFIFRHGGNIVHAEQEADEEAEVFLQRVEFEVAGFGLKRESIGEHFEPLAARFGMRWGLHFSDEPRRMAVLVSKEGHCLYDLLARSKMGELRGEVGLVVSNHPDLEPVARQFGVAFECLPVTPDSKAQQEAKLVEILGQAGIDLVVLARYMQMIGPELVASYAGRMVNIHHAFLPAFPGARPYRQAHARGVKVIGATAHYVTDDLDQGPIIEQDVTRVSHRDSVADLVRKGRDLEKIVLARAVRLHLENRVLVYDNRTVVFD